MTQKMNKFNSLKKTTKVDFATYLGVIVVFIITTILQNNGSLKRSAIGLLVPICCYMSMAVSLNLTVGILGELSLGHAGFMSVGAFSGVIVSQSLLTAVPNAPVRLAIAMVVGAIFAATSDWDPGLIFLMVVAATLLVLGYLIGRDVDIGGTSQT